MHPRQAVLGGEIHDARAVMQEEAIRQHEEGARSLLDDRGQCVLDLFLASHPQGQDFHSQRLGCGLRLLLGDRLKRIRGFQSTATCERLGITSRSSSNRFPLQFRRDRG